MLGDYILMGFSTVLTAVVPVPTAISEKVIVQFGFRPWKGTTAAVITLRLCYPSAVWGQISDVRFIL